MSGRLYRVIQWTSQKVVNDIARVQWAVARIGAWALKQTDEERLNHEVAMVEQQDMLQELRILTATLEIKKQAVAEGGFDEQHGPILAIAANALYDVCEWDDESITDWFSALVLDDNGENLGADIELDEE